MVLEAKLGRANTLLGHCRDPFLWCGSQGTKESPVPLVPGKGGPQESHWSWLGRDRARGKRNRWGWGAKCYHRGNNCLLRAWWDKPLSPHTGRSIPLILLVSTASPAPLSLNINGLNHLLPLLFFFLLPFLPLTLLPFDILIGHLLLPLRAFLTQALSLLGDPIPCLHLPRVPSSQTFSAPQWISPTAPLINTKQI